MPARPPARAPPQSNRNNVEGSSTSSSAPGASALGRQIRDDIVAVALRDALKHPHGGARHHHAACPDPAGDQILVPGPVGGGLEGTGIRESRYGSGLLAQN